VTCQDCGQPVPTSTSGPQRRHCDECRAERKRIRDRAYYAANRADIQERRATHYRDNEALRKRRRDRYTAMREQQRREHKLREQAGVCMVCGFDLQEPDPDQLCGFCRKEAAA
jgi:rubrerythrin